MSETRLVAMDIEDVVAFRSGTPRQRATLQIELIHRYEEGITEEEGMLLLETASEFDSALSEQHFVKDKLRSAFNQENPNG